MTEERYQRTVMQKIRAQKEAKERQKSEALEARRLRKREVIGMAILIPTLFILGLIGYSFAWAIVPPAWW